MRDKSSPLYAFIEGFLVSKSLSPKSKRDYGRYLRQFDTFTGCTSLDEALTLDNASRFVAGLSERGASTAHNGAMYLKSFASWIKKSKYLVVEGGGSRLDGLEAPSVPKAHRQAFSDDQMDAIWKALELRPNNDRPRALALMWLLFATGLRKNEARQVGLKDVHIDGDRSWVLVRAITSKGMKERKVQLDPVALGPLEQYREDHRPTYAGPRNIPEPFFLTREGKPFSEWGFSSWVDRIFDDIERDTSIHGFAHLMRHTWATNFHRASGLTGASVYDLKSQGGWADLNIPLRYTHERPDDEFLSMPTHISALRAVRSRRTA